LKVELVASPELGLQSRYADLLARELRPEGHVFRAQIGRFEKRVLGPEAHDVVSSGEGEGLANGKPRPKRLLAGLRHIAVHVNRPVLGNRESDLIGSEEHRILPSVIRSPTKDLRRQEFPDARLQLGEGQPRGVHAPEQGQGNPSIGIDGCTVTQVGRADDRNLHHVPGSKAVLVNSGKARLR
jgi:hypothetical protein